jgi:hypothetical protein
MEGEWKLHIRIHLRKLTFEKLWMKYAIDHFGPPPSKVPNTVKKEKEVR